MKQISFHEFIRRTWVVLIFIEIVGVFIFFVELRYHGLWSAIWHFVWINLVPVVCYFTRPKERT